MGVGLFVGVWVARYLGPEQFGLLNYAVALSGLFVAIAGLGFHQIAVRDTVRKPEEAGEIFGTALLLQLIAGIISYLLLLGTVYSLRSDNALARSVVAIVGLILFGKSLEIAKYWFESQVQSKYTVWVENGCFLFFAGTKILLILKQAPLFAFAWVTALQSILVGLALILTMNRKGLPFQQLSFAWLRGKKLLHDSWPLILSAVAVSVYMKVDQIMLGQMIGDEAVGIYSAAVRISEVWYFIPVSIVASLYPAILRTKKRSEKLYYQRLQRLYDFLTVIGLVVAVVACFVGKNVILILFGEEYRLSGSVLLIHIWAGIFTSMGVARGPWLFSEGLHHYSYKYILIGMIVNVFGNYAVIPIYGALGAAFITLVSQAVVALVAPALFKETRQSSKMFIKTLNPLRLYMGVIRMGKSHSYK